MSDKDLRDAIELLSADPSETMIMLYNVQAYGLEPGEAFAHADYFGRWEDGRLVAMGGMYELGSLHLYAAEPERCEGAGDYLVELGRHPGFIHAKPRIVEMVLEEFDGRLGSVEGSYPVDLMAFRGPVPNAIDVTGTRPAAPPDIEHLTDMAISLEEELFDGRTIVRSVARELIAAHIEDGTAFVYEDGGRIVSKAEGRLAGGLGSRVGGVYTLPAARGHGHALSCVARLCDHLLTRSPVVTLDVDITNEQSLSIYHRIGFEKVGENLIVTMSP